MIVVDYKPFLVADNSGFVSLINELYYRYTLHSWITWSNELLLYYKEVQKNLSDLLKTVKYVIYLNSRIRYKLVCYLFSNIGIFRDLP